MTQSGMLESLLRLMETASGTNRFREAIVKEKGRRSEGEMKEDEEKKGSTCK